MEIYVLSDQYRKSIVVDQFDSFIWTERFNDFGDFQMTVPPTDAMKELLSEGKVVTVEGSQNAMRIEQTFEQTDSEGRTAYTVKGRTLDAIFESRTVFPIGDDEWVIAGKPGQVVADVVSAVCVVGNRLSTYDKIPELWTVDNTSGTSTIEYDIEPMALSRLITDICKASDIGFRMDVRYDSPKLGFILYTGVNRPQVIFRQDSDMIHEEVFSTSVVDYKNVAYVWAKGGKRIETVVAPGLSTGIAGFDRRVMVVNANDIDPAQHTAAKTTRLLRQRGWAALGGQKRDDNVDGALSEFIPYIYRQDYDLGDIVRWTDSRGVTKSVRVAEYIRTQDAEGEKSYPTFSAI